MVNAESLLQDRSMILSNHLSLIMKQNSQNDLYKNMGGKMQVKMKMTLQRDENLVEGQRQCSDYFCIKIIFDS